MAITKEELLEIIKPEHDIEKISSICSDSKSLLTRIPKEIIEFLEIEKGNKIRWTVKAETKELGIEVIKNE